MKRVIRKREMNFVPCYQCNQIASIVTSTQGGIVPIDGKITWHMDESILSNDMDKFAFIHGLEKAFAEWQPLFSTKFEATSDIRRAQIVFRFRINGDSDLPSPFGENTLAYAYFPFEESLGLNSDVFINDMFIWNEFHTSRGYNFFKVIVHELGHAFGLGHSEDIRDIMYPSYQPNNEVTITQDTKEGIEELYGEKSDCPDNPFRILDQRDIIRLREKTIVAVLKEAGVDATVKDKKAENVNKLLRYLKEK